MSDRSLPVRSPMTIVLLLASLAFLGLGLRTFFLPASAAAFYGAPTESAEALVFVKAYGARNIGISLLALTLIYLDAGMGVGALLAAAALIAGLDAAIMLGHAGFGGALKHLIYVAVLGALAVTTFAVVSIRRIRGG